MQGRKPKTMPDLTREEVEKLRTRMSGYTPKIWVQILDSWLTKDARITFLEEVRNALEARVRELDREVEKASTIIANLLPFEPITEDDIKWAQSKFNERP